MHHLVSYTGRHHEKMRSQSASVCLEDFVEIIASYRATRHFVHRAWLLGDVAVVKGLMVCQSTDQIHILGIESVVG